MGSVAIEGVEEQLEWERERLNFWHNLHLITAVL